MEKNYKKLAREEFERQQQKELKRIEKELELKDKVAELKRIYKNCNHNLKNRKNGHRSDEYCTKCGWDDTERLSLAMRNLYEDTINMHLKWARGED